MENGSPSPAWFAPGSRQASRRPRLDQGKVRCHHSAEHHQDASEDRRIARVNPCYECPALKCCHIPRVTNCSETRDEDAKNDERNSDRCRQRAGLLRDNNRACRAKLSQEQPESRNDKSETHQRNASPYPCEIGSFRRQENARIVDALSLHTEGMCDGQNSLQLPFVTPAIGFGDFAVTTE